MAEFTGLWIPAEVWILEISIHEKVLLSQVIALDNQNGCTADNKYFSDFLGVSKVRVSETINSLCKKGLLTSQIKVNEGNKRILKRSQTFVCNPIKENNDTLANISLIPSQTLDEDLANKSLSLYKEESKFKAKDKTNTTTTEEKIVVVAEVKILDEEIKEENPPPDFRKPVSPVYIEKSISADETESELLKNEKLHEYLAMNLKIKDSKKREEYISGFIKQKEVEDLFPRKLSESKKHFLMWVIKKQEYESTYAGQNRTKPNSNAIPPRQGGKFEFK